LPLRIDRLQALASSLLRCGSDPVAVRSVLVAVHQLLAHPDAGIAVLGSGTAVPAFTRLLAAHASDEGLAQSLLSVLELAAGVPGGCAVLASADLVPALLRVLRHLTHAREAGHGADGAGSPFTAPLLAACTLLLRVVEDSAGRASLLAAAGHHEDGGGAGEGVDVASTLAAAAAVCVQHDPGLGQDVSGLAAALRGEA
jgi:hypothetical protein